MPKRLSTRAEQFALLGKLYEAKDKGEYVPVLPWPTQIWGPGLGPGDVDILASNTSVQTQQHAQAVTVDGVEGTEQPVSASLQPVHDSRPSTLVASAGSVLATAGSSSTVPTTRGSLIPPAPLHSANNDDDKHMARQDNVRMERLRGPEVTLNEHFAAYPWDSGVDNHDPTPSPETRKPKKHIVCAQCESFTHSLDRLAVRFSSRTALKKHERTQHTEWDQLELAMVTNVPFVYDCPSGDFTSNRIDEVQIHCTKDSCVDHKKYRAMRAKKEMCKPRPPKFEKTLYFQSFL